MSDKRFGKFGMLELPLGVQSVIDHPVQAYVKNPLGLRGAMNYACFNFTGANYADVANLSGLDPSAGYTVFCWLKPGETTGTATRAAWMMRTDANNSAHMAYPASTFSTSSYSYTINGSSDHKSSSVNVPAVWTPVALSHVGATITFRVGAAKSATTGGDVSGRVGDTTPLRLGGYLFSNNYLGLAANYIFFSGVAITDQQFADLAAWKNPIGMTGLVAWYICPKVDGSIVDSSGNGNTPTPTGDSLYSATGGPGLPWWPV